MCGFLFNFSRTGEFKNFKEELFINNFNTIIHRGPDESGFIFKKNYAVGSCRLKIFDLVNGKMPLYDFTSLSCAQIGEALTEARSSSKVRDKIPTLLPWAERLSRCFL